MTTHLDARTTIAEVMTLSPHTIAADETLARAHDVMRTHQLRHLPVVRGNELVGILSQRDLYFVEAVAGVDRSVEAVAEAMGREIYTVAPGNLVADVARTMGNYRLGCAVVVDVGRVVGIFTATDALMLLSRAAS